MAKIGKVIGWGAGGLLLLVFVIGLAAGDPKQGEPAAAAAATEAPPPAMKVTATELFRAYDANEAAAQQKYGDRALEVSGTVAGIDLDFADNPVVKLSTPNDFTPAQADLTDASRPKAASLAKGQKVTLRCEGVGEIVGTPMLKACDILD